MSFREGACERLFAPLIAVLDAIEENLPIREVCFRGAHTVDSWRMIWKLRSSTSQRAGLSRGKSRSFAMKSSRTQEWRAEICDSGLAFQSLYLRRNRGDV